MRTFIFSASLTFVKKRQEDLAESVQTVVQMFIKFVGENYWVGHSPKVSSILQKQTFTCTSAMIYFWLGMAHEKSVVLV